jgi:hypothetical protein
MRIPGLRIAAVLLLLLLGCPATAQEAGGPASRTVSADKVRLTVELDRTRLLIDDQVRLSLRVEAPEDLLVELPEFADQAGQLSVVSRERSEPRPAASGSRLWEQSYLLQPEDVGDIALPPLLISYQGPSRPEPMQLGIEPPGITVDSVLPAGADVTRPKDIGPPVALPPSGWRLAAWIVGGALILLALLLAALARRRTSRPSAASARPAHLEALEELDRLEGARLLEGGQMAELYTRLADILRHYALHRFGLSAPTQTTEELLAGLDGLSLADGPGWAMAPLLTDCDLVKFARHRPSRAAAEQALQGARSFVRETATTAGGATAPA